MAADEPKEPKATPIQKVVRRRVDAATQRARRGKSPAVEDLEPDTGRLPPAERAKLAHAVARMAKYNPGGYEERLDYEGVMQGSGKSRLVRMGPSDELRENVAMIVRGGRGAIKPSVAAGSMGVPREVFHHWMEVGRMSIDAFGHKIAHQHSELGLYVKWWDACARAVDAAEVRLISEWVKKADADNGAPMLLALAKYVAPQRFVTVAEQSPKELPAATSSDGTDTGPVRFFLPVQDELVPPADGSAKVEKPLIIELDEAPADEG